MNDSKNTQIIQCIRRMFLRYGLKSVTMDDIARELGMSKKTLYVHFRDKNDMILRILSQFIDTHKVQINRILEQNLNAIDENFEIVKMVGEEIAEIRPTVFFDLKKYYPEAWRFYEAFKQEFIQQMVVANLEKGIREGLYRDSLNIEVIAINYTNMVNMVFDSEIYPYKQYDFRAVYLEIFRYHIRGIASQAGIDYLVKKMYELPQQLRSTNTNITQ